MLSLHLQSVLCDDAGAIFRDTCDRPVEDVLKSEDFISFADSVRSEIPELDDRIILKHLIVVHTAKIQGK